MSIGGYPIDVSVLEVAEICDNGETNLPLLEQEGEKMKMRKRDEKAR